jgi:hypothetical protein
MIMFLVLLVSIATACVLIAKEQRRRAYTERHYLYRVRCALHPAIEVAETSFYPDLGEFYCFVCSWRAEGNLFIEQRPINYFGDWEQVG